MTATVQETGRETGTETTTARLSLELDADTLARTQAAAAAAGLPLDVWLQGFVRDRLAEACPAPDTAWRDLPEPGAGPEGGAG